MGGRNSPETTRGFVVEALRGLLGLWRFRIFGAARCRQAARQAQTAMNGVPAEIDGGKPAFTNAGAPRR